MKLCIYSYFETTLWFQKLAILGDMSHSIINYRRSIWWVVQKRLTRSTCGLGWRLSGPKEPRVGSHRSVGRIRRVATMSNPRLLVVPWARTSLPPKRFSSFRRVHCHDQQRDKDRLTSVAIAYISNINELSAVLQPFCRTCYQIVCVRHCCDLSSFVRQHLAWLINSSNSVC